MILSVDTCFPLIIYMDLVLYIYVYVYIHTVYIYTHIQISIFLQFCCITFLFKTNKINKWTYICKRCVLCLCFFQLPSTVPSLSRTYTHIHTHMHTHTPHATGKRVRYTCLKPLPADTALPSFSSQRTVVSLHHPQPPCNRRRPSGWVGLGWRARLQVLCLWPAQQPR